MSLLRLELWRACRNTAVRLGLSLLLVCFILALIYGKTQVERQSKIISELHTTIRESDEAYFKTRFKDDEQMGRVHYYLRRPTAHVPLPQAALSLGQRDLHSYHQSAWLRSLYSNLFDAGFENPGRTEAGHFDLAFVIVFFLPLVVIATTFDLLSGEKQGKTLPLLRSSHVPLHTILRTRLLARLILLSTVVLSFVATALLLVGAGAAAYLPWGLTIFGYILFWFGLCSIVISLAGSSARNAGLLLALWTLLAVIAPTLLNLLLPRKALENGAALTIRCRQVVNNGWDIDKAKTQTAAALRVPLYEQAHIPTERFTWAWYYAMHDAGDEAVEKMARTYFQGLKNKDEQAFHYSLLSPPVRVQLLFDKLAGTDQSSHLGYYRFVRRAREKFQAQYLPDVLQEKTIKQHDLLQLHDSLTVLEYRPDEPEDWGWAVAQLWLVALFTVLFGLHQLSLTEKRIRKRES